MIKTNNVYYATYLMHQGLWIATTDIKYDKKHGKTVIFSFYGQDEKEEKEAERQYDSEKASVNIRRYLDNLVFIRNIMYNKIKREEETEKIGERSNGKRVRKIKIKN